MNTADYEKAKQECWDAVFDELIKGSNVPSCTAYDVCCCAFKHAYRLGMEAAKKEQQRGPKYKVGGIAKLAKGTHHPLAPDGTLVRILSYNSEGDFYSCAFTNNIGIDIDAKNLEPYTEPQEERTVNTSDIDIDEIVSKGYLPDPTKHFDNIVKDSFRSKRRLNIATQILCAIIPKFENGDIGLTISDEQDIMQVACRLANMLIAESDKAEYK